MRPFFAQADVIRFMGAIWTSRNAAQALGPAAFRFIGIASILGFVICLASAFRRFFSPLFVVVIFGLDMLFNRVAYSTRRHDGHESHPLLLIRA